MGYIEVQYREARLSEAIRVEFNALPLPLDTLEAQLPGGQLIDSWECNTVTFVAADMNGAPAPSGTVIARADLEFRLADAAAAQAAGSGNAPATTAVQMAAFIAIAGTSGSGGAFSRQILGLLVNGQAFNVPGFTLPSITMPATQGVTIATSWAGRGAGNVLFRLGTPVAGPLGGLAIVNRIPGGEDWALLLSGTLLAETTQSQITEAASASPEADIEEDFVAHWSPIFQQVFCTGWIVIPDQCGFLNVDISVELTAAVSFSFDAALDDPLRMQVRLSWNASDWDTFKCAFGIAFIGGLIGAIVGALVFIVAPPLGAFIAGVGLGVAIIALIAVPMIVEDAVDAQAQNAPPPEDLEQIDSDDDSVTYAGPVPLPAPSVGGVQATVNAMVPSIDGVLLVGNLSLPIISRALSVQTFDPWYYSGYSCDTDTWSAEYYDGSVVLYSSMPNFRLRSVPTVSPASTWQIADSQQLMARVNQSLEVVVSPNGSPKVGAVAELLVHTTAGLRWVRLGPVPSPPKKPSFEELNVRSLQCKLERLVDFPDDWPLGKFNPKWHIDPPPADRLFRQWGVVYERLPVGSVVRFAVVEDDALDEQALELGRVTVDSSGKLAQLVVTSDTQRILVEVDGSLTGHVAPRMRQQWLAPVAAIPGAGQLDELVAVGSQRGAPRPQLTARGLPVTSVYHRGHWVVAERGRLLVCVTAGAMTQEGAIRG